MKIEKNVPDFSNESLERAIIDLMIIHGREPYREVCQIISENSFYTGEFARAYKLLGEVFAQRETVDYTTFQMLYEKAFKHKFLDVKDKIIDREKLYDVSEIKSYATDLQELANKRRVRDTCLGFLETLNTKFYKRAAELASICTDEVMELNFSQSDELYDADATTAFIEYIKKIREGRTTPMFKTGLTALDRFLEGGLCSGISVVQLIRL